MGRLLSELKRRQMFRVAAAYAVVAWLLLQVVNNVAPVLDLPPWVARAFLLLLVIGFPITLLLAWLRELGPADGAAPKTATTRLDYVLAGALILVIVLVSYQQLVPASREASPDASPQPSDIAVAVLKFENLSGDASQDYFSEGMTEEIGAVLTRVPNLNVVGRTSAIAIDRQNRSVRELGQSLGATHLIDGSVRRAGNRVRITAQLIRADNGLNLWSESFDRELTDIFAIQEDIARSIAGALSVPLGLAQGEPIVSSRNIDPDLYAQYLRAKALVRARGTEGLRVLTEATVLLEQVVARDPEFAPAWALLVLAYVYTPLNDPALSASPFDEYRRALDAYLARAEPAAQRAIQLAPNQADGYVSLGIVHQLRHKWLLADELNSKGLALDQQIAPLRVFRALRES